MKAFDLISAATSFFEECVRSENVRANKYGGMIDGTVDVRLGGKMNDRVDAFHGAMNDFWIRDVSVDEGIAGFINPFQILKIPCIGEGIKIDDFVFGMSVQPVSDEVGSDEAGTAGNQEFHALRFGGSLVPSQRTDLSRQWKH